MLQRRWSSPCSSLRWASADTKGVALVGELSQAMGRSALARPLLGSAYLNLVDTGSFHSSCFDLFEVFDAAEWPKHQIAHGLIEIDMYPLIRHSNTPQLPVVSPFDQGVPRLQE